MRSQAFSEGWKDLVDELKELETFFPLLGIAGERDELEEEIGELRALIATAGFPEDEQSRQALNFLRHELARKQGLLDSLD